MLGNAWSLTASIQCWKANFCALASKDKPFPTCQTQLTWESNSQMVLILIIIKITIYLPKQIVQIPVHYPYITLRTLYIYKQKQLKREKERPWKRWVWPYSSVRQQSQANWRTKLYCGLASRNQSLATFANFNHTFFSQISTHNNNIKK